MTLYEFNQMKMSEKAETTWKGVFIADREVSWFAGSANVGSRTILYENIIIPKSVFTNILKNIGFNVNNNRRSHERTTLRKVFEKPSWREAGNQGILCIAILELVTINIF